MRTLLVGLTALAIVAVAAPVNGATTLLAVDDGDFFYCTPAFAGDCPLAPPANAALCHGDTDNNLAGVATRHWHQGSQFVNIGGGFGCLGAPKVWTITVPVGSVGEGIGKVRYTWDRDVPGGGNQNEVHIHVYALIANIQSPVPVYTTLLDGSKPVSPAMPIREHPIDFDLLPGTYRIVENIWGGPHTAWLTELTVTANP